MNWRAMGIALGCSGLLAGAAASHYLGPTPAEPVALSAPLFAQSAKQVVPTTSNMRGAVAFNDEMIALLTMGANAARAPHVAAASADDDVAPHTSRDRRTHDHRRTRSTRLTRAERRRLERARIEARRMEARQAWAAASDDEMVDVQVRDRRGRMLRTHRVPRDMAPPPAPTERPFRMFAPFGDW